MTERSSKNQGLLQVQYAFPELPKMPARRPEAPGADPWAWLFVHAPELTEVPADLLRGPYGEALELADKTKLTAAELQAHEQARDEIRQVREIAEARWAEGETVGFAKGEIAGILKAKAEAVLAFLAARSVVVSTEVRSRIDRCTSPEILD